MSTPLNPLIVARLRKYWNKYDIELGCLLYELEGWVHILGPGPNMPKCEYCKCDLCFDWKLCKNCSNSAPLCYKCYQCSYCENAERSEGCSECGVSCGAYMCLECKRLSNQY